MNHSLYSFADAFSPAFEADDAAHASKTVEATNVERVQAFYRAVAQGDYEAIHALLTPDITFEIIGAQGLPSAGAHGIDEVMAQTRANFEAIMTEESMIETMVAQGDMLMAVAYDRGHFRSTSTPYSLQLIMHYTFREGRICRFREWMFPLPE